MSRPLSRSVICYRCGERLSPSSAVWFDPCNCSTNRPACERCYESLVMEVDVDYSAPLQRLPGTAEREYEGL
jgi:hypothetical protein